MSDTFHRDLSWGKEVERKHLAIIQKTYPNSYMIDGYCKEWDIYCPDAKIGFEIKSDKMSQKTGNIVVEISFNGKPSALSTTKSKYWIFDTGIKSIMVEVEELKKLVVKFHPVTFTARGDSKSKDAYLIKQKYIEGIGVTL